MISDIRRYSSILASPGSDLSERVRRSQKFIFILFLVLLNSCITQFVPQIEEEKELLVVQGLITDQHETDTIKLSESLPLGQIDKAKPVHGYSVTISDNLGNIVYLSETVPGTYLTPSSRSEEHTSELHSRQY